MKLFYGARKDKPVSRATDVRDYLHEENRYQYQDGYSMAEAAKCWIAAAGVVPSGVATVVGSDELSSAHFEFPTKVWGRGTSMTDVMAFLPKSVVAIEAKVAESFGDPVSLWIMRDVKSDPTSVARREAIIERYASALSIDAKQLFGIRYQLLHRTLSAALTARRERHSQAWMVVQSFPCVDKDAHRRNWEDFSHFRDLVGAAPTLAGISVQLAWTDAETA